MVIDAMSCFVPLPDVFGAAGASLARLDGYLEHFDPSAVAGKQQAQIESDAFAAAKARCPSTQDFLARLDDAQIDKALVYNEIYETSLGISTTTNDNVAAFVAQNPTRFIAAGGVDVLSDASIDDMERSVRDLGIQGFVVAPMKYRLHPTDERLKRVYSNCQRLGVPVLLHGGINWWRDAPYEIGHPRHIDEIASLFPRLKIVVLHAGWPWMLDMMMVAWRHPRVYLDISAHRPKHFTIPASGWEPMLHFGNRALQDRILFGSAWTLYDVSLGSLVDEVRNLPLKPAVIDKWLGANAARVFEL